jgi:hypothetical protein
MTSVDRVGGRSSAAFVAVLVGAFAGIAVSAGLIAVGVRELDELRGVAIHFGLALGLAALLGARSEGWRARRSARAIAVLALLLTFVLRRWLTVWVNLEALAWGSGPAGHTTAIVFPIEGLILGMAFAVDSLRAPVDTRSSLRHVA